MRKVSYSEMTKMIGLVSKDIKTAIVYKTLLKGIKETKINRKKCCVYGLKDLILLRCPHYPKQSTD